LDLESLTAADVGVFVALWLPGLSTAPARSTVTALRSLLSFLHATGVVATPLASVVPAVASWRLAGLPIGLTPAQVQALLGACDRSAVVGRRDFAIVTLLARLGLRAGEVAALTLDDIDWRAGTLTVHGKATTYEQLPLPVDVGSVLSGYLEHGRPSRASGRAVFIRAKAPYRALDHKSISTMVNRAAGRAGLGTVHAHLLRHTLATQVLAAGHHSMMWDSYCATVPGRAPRSMPRVGTWDRARSGPRSGPRVPRRCRRGQYPQVVVSTPPGPRAPSTAEQCSPRLY
jgi:integrase/recombinase XerD